MSSPIPVEFRPKERFHDLDSLRAAMMFLGIVIHAAISFAPTKPQIWPVLDERAGDWAIVLIYILHTWRMQLFFLLAGFFAILLYERYGLVGMLVHRSRRILLPLILAVATIGLATQIIWFWLERRAIYLAGGPADVLTSERRFLYPFDCVPVLPPTDAVAEFLRRGQFLDTPWFHLWFLVYLVWCFALLVPVLLIGRLFARTGLGIWSDRQFHRLCGSRFRSLLAALPFIPLLWRMNGWLVETPTSWLPPPHLLAYYFLFFVLGGLVYRHRELLPRLTASWRTHFVVGHLVALPTALGLTLHAMNAGDLEPPPLDAATAWVKLAAMAAYSWYTVLMILAMSGLFRRYFAAPSALRRYLADSSYWCYLASIPILLVLQAAISEIALAGFVKFVLLNLVTFALLLLSYELGVRHTFLGRILNGSREQPESPPTLVTPERLLDD